MQRGTIIAIFNMMLMCASTPSRSNHQNEVIMKTYCADTISPKYDDKPYPGKQEEGTENGNQKIDDKVYRDHDYDPPYDGPITRTTRRVGGTPPFMPEVPPVNTMHKNETDSNKPKERETRKF